MPIYFDQLPKLVDAIPFVGEAPPGHSPLGRRDDSRCTDLFRGHGLGLTDVIIRSSRDGEPSPSFSVALRNASPYSFRDGSSS